jgi:hypothetical protein
LYNFGAAEKVQHKQDFSGSELLWLPIFMVADFCDCRSLWGTASQAAERLPYSVILSEAKNLSSI